MKYPPPPSVEPFKKGCCQINPCTPGQRSHGDPTASKKNADRRCARRTIASISVATQWHRQWMLWDRIERRPTARTLGMLKTNAVAMPLLDSAVGSPYDRHSSAVRSPTTQ